MIEPFHFTKSLNDGFPDFYDSVTSCNGVVCFDFEDSIYEQDPGLCALRKQFHRNFIVQKIRKLKEVKPFTQIGFRINGMDTAFYRDDLMAIRTIDFIHSLFLPKIESEDQLKFIFKEQLPCIHEFIPIIETRKGFDQVEEILSVQHPSYRRIAFGHCDYNLSMRYFPFYHQDSNRYWEWINVLSGKAKEANKQLINSPVLRLEDGAFFSGVISRNKSFDNINGQISLCLDQTQRCYASSFENAKCINESSIHYSDSIEIAVQLVSHYEQYKLADRSFAIDHTGRLISPQEYQSAKSLLKELTV
jgi:hypothetical protein